MQSIDFVIHLEFPLKSLAMLVTKPSRYVQGNHGHSFVRLWSRIKTLMLEQLQCHLNLHVWGSQ